MRHAGDHRARVGVDHQSLAVSSRDGAVTGAGAVAPADPLAVAVARMRALAEQAGEALLTEGPVHPDHQLLAGCAEVLPLLVQAERARRARSKSRWYHLEGEALRAAHVEDECLARVHIQADDHATPKLRRLTKLRATTPAGIYARRW